MLALSVLLVVTLLSGGVSALEKAIFPFEISEQNTSTINLLKKIELVRSISIGWCSQEKARAIAGLILNTKPLLCVEVGVFGGSSLFPVALTLSHLNAGKIYAVDSWDNNDCIKFMPEDDPNKKWWSEIDLISILQSFYQNLNDLNLFSFCEVIREDSVDAAKQFKDQSIEYLHLNGNHTFLGTQRDIRAYLPKVAPGGYILMSDVRWMIGSKTPIHDAVWEVFKYCEYIDSIENHNVYLFRKN